MNRRAFIQSAAAIVALPPVLAHEQKPTLYWASFVPGRKTPLLRNLGNPEKVAVIFEQLPNGESVSRYEFTYHNGKTVVI